MQRPSAGVFCFRLFRLTMASRRQQAWACPCETAVCRSWWHMGLLLGGAAQRCRGEVQQARSDSSSISLSRGPAGQLCPGQDLGRADTPMARDRNTRNLGCDNVRLCVRLHRRQRRVATMQQGLRSRACKRPRDQLLRIRPLLLVAADCACAEQLSTRVTAGRGGRVKSEWLDG